MLESSTIKSLTKLQLRKFRKQFPDWQLNTNATKATLTAKFRNHIDALTFMARVTVHAEVLQHHPDILFTYATLKITLTTHEAQALTMRDVALADCINKLCTEVNVTA